jgi:YfiH family protein
LAAVADHCFTTRAPALGTGPLATGDGWHRVALSMGVSPPSIVRLRQMHGTRVVSLRRQQAFPPAAPDWDVGDIAASDDATLALCVKVADCVPILLADMRRGTVAAVHAGWRGTAAGAAQAAVEALAEGFGAAPADIVAAIGPSIGPCCYRVGRDVRAAFEAAGEWGGSLDRWFSGAPTVEARRGVPGLDPSVLGGGPALFLDTWLANADQLRAAGVPASRIHVSRVCTSCHRDVFHSYRVDGARAGRMIGVVRARERQPEGVRSHEQEARSKKNTFRSSGPRERGSRRSYEQLHDPVGCRERRPRELRADS